MAAEGLDPGESSVAARARSHSPANAKPKRDTALTNWFACCVNLNEGILRNRYVHTWILKMSILWWTCSLYVFIKDIVNSTL